MFRLPHQRPGLGDSHPKPRSKGRKRLSVQTKQAQSWEGSRVTRVSRMTLGGRKGEGHLLGPAGTPDLGVKAEPG